MGGDGSGALHLQEGMHCFGVELGAGVADDLIDSILVGAGTAVWAVGSHSVIGVDDGEDACADGYIFTLKASGVSATIVVLMVRVDDLGTVLQRPGYAR